MLAMIAANTVNYSMGRPEKPVHPKDFMPSQWDSKAPHKKRITKAERQHIANSVRGLFNGYIELQKRQGIQ